MRRRHASGHEVALTFLLAMALSRHAAGQTPSTAIRPEFGVPDGAASAVAASESIIFVGGGFSRFGPYTGAFAVADADSAAVDPDIANAVGEVFAVAGDEVGGWFIGGVFSEVGGETRHDLAYLQSDGSLGAWNPRLGGEVRALLVDGGVLYAGGDRIRAIDARSGVVLWETTLDEIVTSLCLLDDVLYVGGFFDEIDDTPRSNLAALDAATGQLLPFQPDVQGSIDELLVTATTLYAAGYFTAVDGMPRDRLAAFDVTDGSLFDWSPSANDGVTALLIDGATLYIGGGFDVVDGQPRSRLAAVHAVTGDVLGWSPAGAGDDGSNSGVRALAMTGGNIVAGGSFTSVNGQARHHLAMIDTAGATLPWRADAAGDSGTHVNCVEVRGSTVAAGGKMQSIGSESRRGLAAMSSVSGELLDWNPALMEAVGGPITVRDLLVGGNILYVAGSYDDEFVNAQPLVAAIRVAGGALVGSFDIPDQPVHSVATSLELRGNTVYVGYDIGSGQGQVGVGTVDATTGTFSGLLVVPSNGVQCLALEQSEGVLYFGGEFDGPRMFGAAMAIVDNQLTPFDAMVDDHVLAMLRVGETMYLGGRFDNASGQGRERLAALDATTGVVQSWNAGIDAASADYVADLDRLGGSLIVAGRFTLVGGAWRPGLAAIDLQTAQPEAWAPELYSVASVAHNDDVLVAVGDFSHVTARPRPYVAAFEMVPCTADTNGDNAVDVNDLAAVIIAWGPCSPPDPCPADLTGDGVVDVDDLVQVITNWGRCTF